MMNEPLYQKIYDYLIEKIKNGDLLPGDRVPSEAELSIKFAVSRITSKKALEMLSSKGFISRIAGKGSFVAQNVDKTNNNVQETGNRASGSRLVGYITTDFADTFGTGLVAGIEKQAAEFDYNVIVKRSHGDIKAEEAALNSLLQLGVEGIIIMPTQGEYYSDSILKLYLDEYPIVFLDRYLKGIPVPYITSDNFKSAKHMADFLFDSGHRHIALLSPPIANTTTLEERLNGFIESHAQREIVPDQSLWLTDINCTLPDMFTEENQLKDLNRIIRFIKENPQITAIFACEYNIAYIAAVALESADIRVPEDVQIACFDGPHVTFNDYYLTYTRQDEEGMGMEAVKVLKKLLDGSEDIPKKIVVDSKLMVSRPKKSLLLQDQN